MNGICRVLEDTFCESAATRRNEVTQGPGPQDPQNPYGQPGQPAPGQHPGGVPPQDVPPQPGSQPPPPPPPPSGGQTPPPPPPPEGTPQPRVAATPHPRAGSTVGRPRRRPRHRVEEARTPQGSTLSSGAGNSSRRTSVPSSSGCSCGDSPSSSSTR